MISLAAPTADVLRAWARTHAEAPHTYLDVAASQKFDLPDYRPPRGFVLDRRRIRLGEGKSLYNAARNALLLGNMFPRGWLVSAWPQQPPQAGDLVGVAARCFGIWWWNAARIVYVDGVDSAPASADAESHRTVVAYGTLPAHVEMGEERFLVERLADGGVWYDVSAFSSPRHPLVRMAYPLARRMQSRFGRESLAAMQQSVEPAAVGNK